MAVATTGYLDEIENGFQQILKEARIIIDSTDEALLNQPEAPGKWSMLQCLEHMSLASKVYVDNVEQKLNNGQLPTASPRYKGHWKGRMFAKMNAPKPGGEIPMKLKTFKFMEPENTLDANKVINEFFSVHERFIELINESRSINIDKVKVVTALGSMVRLRMGEAFRFLLAHTQRHMVQLKRIKNTVSA